jgi:hypothetical protein
MADTQQTPTQPNPSKKMKINPVVPALIVFFSIAAFLAVWYLAVR